MQWKRYSTLSGVLTILYNLGFVPGPRDFSIHSIIFGIVLLLNELRYSNRTAGAKSKCVWKKRALKVKRVFAFFLKKPQLWKTSAPQQIELQTSTWAHFKEPCLVFKISPSWSQSLNSLGRNKLKKLYGYLPLIRKENQLLELLSLKWIEQLS